MRLPWWVWLLLALYAGMGLYCFIALLTLRPIGGLPEEGEQPPKPLPLWLEVIRWPVAFLVVLVLWPTLLWPEVWAKLQELWTKLRHYHDC